MNGPVKIKTEPIAPSPLRSQRLQGFKVPRDLSLGGLGAGKKDAAPAANKKVFTPNLNVSRNKSSPVESSATNARSQRGAKTERGRGGRGGGARGRGAKTAIQSIGLFSEGIAGQPARRSTQGRPSYNDGTATLRRPTLVKTGIKVDDHLEKESLKELLDEYDEDGPNKMDVKLALDDDFHFPIVLKEANGVSTLAESKYPESLSHFFQRTQPQLFLIQLPDTLPGQGNETAEVKKAEDVTATEPEANAPDVNNFCLMKGLQEGLIGKFIRFKSGKTKLVLGNTLFDVDLGVEPGFLQEVISIRTNPNERNGDMINLGKIEAKVNVSPDWEEMFQAIN